MAESSQWWSGVSMMPRALAYLYRNPSLIPWVLAPTVLTVGAIAAGAAATITVVPWLIRQFLVQPSNPGLLILWWIGVASLMVSVLAMSTAIAWVAGNMASAPFYDVIAGRVENKELGTLDDDFAWSRVLGDAWMSVRHSLAAIGIYLAVMVPLFALNLIPGVGSVLYTVLSTAATVFFVSREIMDVPLSRRRLSFRDKLDYILKHRQRIGGHGAVVALLFMIPFANLLVTPVAVLGASLVFCDIERERSRALVS